MTRIISCTHDGRRHICRDCISRNSEIRLLEQRERRPRFVKGD